MAVLLATLALMGGPVSCAEGAPLGEAPADITATGGSRGRLIGESGGDSGGGLGGHSGSVGAAGISASNGAGGSGGVGVGGSSGSAGAISGSDGGPGEADACSGTADRDHDGQPDCIDGCPDDATKSQPGKCGCGVSEADRDKDNTPDCLDACADDPAKTQPGTCGCGTPESCGELKSALVHRYRFLGTGTTATDSIGTAHGTIINAALSGSVAGSVVLAGGTSDQYVDLPNNIIHTLTNATFEGWITWQGGGAWQRIFDFGDEMTQVEGAQGTGRSYLFLAATSGGAAGVPRSAYQKAGSPEVIVNSIKSLPTGVMSHVAVVADDQNNKLLIYLDGALEASTPWNDSLSLIHDINVWLGRSQYGGDAELGATYHEFRIYDVALSAAQIGVSAKAGPDPAFLN